MDVAKEDAVQAAPLVEIHFDSSVIDHPLLPIRWCLSKEATKLMREHPLKSWALIIFAQESWKDVERWRADRKVESRLVVEGFEAIARGQDYLQFRAPGKYDVVAYLVSSHAGNKTSRHSFSRSLEGVDRRREGHYTEGVFVMEANSTLDANQQASEGGKKDELLMTPVTYPSIDYVETHGNYFVQVDIPKGIFAAELSPWVRKYLNWIGLGAGEDQCAGRWRLAVGFLIMPFVVAVLYVLGFTLFRLWALVMGFLHFLVGGNPLIVWRLILSWRWAHPESDTFWMKDDFELMPIYNPDTLSMLFVPIVWCFFGSSYALTYFMPEVGLSLLALGGVIVLIVVGIAIFGDKLEGFIESVGNSPDDQKALQAVERVERYVACSVERQKPQVIHFSWSGLKRKVCKPRAMR